MKSSFYFFCLFPSSFACNKICFFFFKRFRLLLISLSSTTLLGGSLPRTPESEKNLTWEPKGVSSSRERNSWDKKKDSFLFMPCKNELPDASSEWAGLVRRPGAQEFQVSDNPWPEATGSSQLHLSSSLYNGDNNTSKVCAN